jgi:hypothetical protein
MSKYLRKIDLTRTNRYKRTISKKVDDDGGIRGFKGNALKSERAEDLKERPSK